MLQKLWNDESGLIICAELVLILTICILGIIVGLSQVVVTINEELLGSAHAIGVLNQSFTIPGFVGCRRGGVNISGTIGSFNNDGRDDCDCFSACDMIIAGIILDGRGG